MVKKKKKTLSRTAGLLLASLAVYIVVKALILAGMLSPYWSLVMDQALITTVGALGLCIIYGFSGQFSLGHAAFYGIGAYAAAFISKTYGHGSMAWFLLALPAGALAAGLVAFLIGLPILRLRSDYLGIATLGFGIIVKVGMDNSHRLLPVLGGATGIAGLQQAASFDSIFLSTVVAVLLTRNFVQSSYGRACTAIRDDEIAADIMGIDTTKYKVTAFVFGCALAGLAGALYVHRYPFLHPSTFDFLKSFDFLLIVVLGGLGSISGTVITSIAWVFLLEGLRFVLGQQFIEFRGVIYALILVVTILLRPQGIFGGKELLFLKPPKANLTAASGKEGPHADLGD
ncbi:MAG TPA: branched-chain amino acid ABC transporter permease [Bacillota bacterium]|nr:branched-chain amino acid ABC transporter permease [Bacillota bacterium]